MTDDVKMKMILNLEHRVTKLETIVLQEVIEFFIPVGDLTTEIQEPVFDKKKW